MRVLVRADPQRSIALATETHVLIFRHSSSSTDLRTGSSTSVAEHGAPKCIVEFLPWEKADMEDYRSLSSLKAFGTLGLVTLAGDVFLCVVNSASRVATVRPGEDVQRIVSVEFHCLNRSDYDHLLNDQINPFPTDGLDADGYDHGHKESLLEHPCMALKKLLGGGTFYYSADFDLTKRVQDRPAETSSVTIDSLDGGFLWNTYMIQPLVDFRSRLSDGERRALDTSRILTSAIRGFALSVTIPAASSPARIAKTGQPSSMTLISRLSCRRAGTRFNSRGIDDDGNVANFVETETIFNTDYICFSYVQCRGSVPLFWEQASGLPGQQKVTITRSFEATQPAFDEHFMNLSKAYGDVHVVNLLSKEKPAETELTRQYDQHIRRYVQPANDGVSHERREIRSINYDFHAETRGPHGYEAASGIKHSIQDSTASFEYYLSEETQEQARVEPNGRRATLRGPQEVLKQNGIFRTNCLDCLDRTNLVQTIISQIALDTFLRQHEDRPPTSDFWARHGILWADCGDALSKIYAGTGALKSSFTRHGKMSLAGAVADLRKSAQRLYINNFEDKGRQNTIDMLLGRLMGQMPVHLYDPINDYVTAELERRQTEFTEPKSISIWVGTFNLNGKTNGIHDDLSSWLCPEVDEKLQLPEIVAVAFQEIVELNAQQIVQTDMYRRHQWEEAVRETLNKKTAQLGSEDYVLLRGGQLVGASLSVFVRVSALPFIKNVEGSIKKTGLSGMAGNKGAVAIRMDYADTSLCLVTAHLAAGFANYEERNQDYRTISSGLRFQRNRTIEDHKTIIWFGDFNYRIGLGNERVRQLIDAKDLGTLYENDQLNLQMVNGRTFPYYSEKTPTFMPTYKYNLNSDLYDTSEKGRIPAWCDRILTRGDNLRQLYYEASSLRFSDHRPVWGLFDCKVNVVNEADKERISSELYAKRRIAVGKNTAVVRDGASDDDSINGYDSLEPGLPPASSDKRKWWLDGGMPARSTVNAPSDAHAPNPNRPANPFTPSSEPDWVKIDKPSAPPSRNASRQISAQSSSGTLNRPTAESRTFPPPSNSHPDPPAQPARPVAALDGTSSPPSQQTHLKTTLRKPAPPQKPQKPNVLRSNSNTSTVSTSSARAVAPPPPAPRRGGIPTAPTAVADFPPPPRRVTGLGDRALAPAPAPTKQKGGEHANGDGEMPPGLPPRRQTGLMDQDGEDEIKGWDALRPT
nr:hypothetical protein B0A51_17157 [Rachicladosporium sp. CCFEE 5018]